MAFQFPWTNLHELNLDWFLSKFKQFTDNYLGTTATAESVPNGIPPSVTVTGGELDDDTDIVDPFTFNFKIPAGAQGEQGVQGVPGQDGFSPIATVTKSGTVATITITDANGTTTATISDGEVTQAQLDTKAPAIIPTVSETIASFPDGADDLPVSELIIDIEPNQSGSGDPAPDNIRPISGWTGANITRCGANILDLDNWTINPNVPMTISNGTITLSNSGYQESRNKYILPDTSTYTLSFHVKTIALNDPSASFATYFDGVKTIGKTGTGGQGNIYLTSVDTEIDVVYTVTGKSEVAFGGWAYGGTVEISNIQLEPGTKATTYAPYSPATVAFSWQTEAGTVYGGSLDAKTGILTVTHQLVQLPATASWVINNNAGYASLSSLGITPPMKNPPVGTPSRTLTRTNWCRTNALIPTSTGWGATASSNDPQFVVSYDDYLMVNIGVAHPTSAQINQFITDVGLQLYYPLATVQTYQLTPQQLFNTLYGGNNVWSDTGNTTVTYTADTMLYIQNLTQPTEDDMVANTAIDNGKFFMIGNNLYRATTTIASGSQIIPGTNATPMSLADALNLL